MLLCDWNDFEKVVRGSIKKYFFLGLFSSIFYSFVVISNFKFIIYLQYAAVGYYRGKWDTELITTNWIGSRNFSDGHEIRLT